MQRNIGIKGRVVSLSVVLGVLVAGLSACSSASSSTSGSSGSGTAGNSSEAAAAATAKAFYTPYLAAPTAIPQTTPLNSAPPKGKLFIILQGDVPSAKPPTAAAESALTAIGWQYKVLNYQDADSSTLISAMKLALQYKPAAVMLTGVAESLWASEVPAYKAAGVPVVPIDLGLNTVPISATIPGQVGLDATQAGKIVASWFISQSQGSGKALVLDIPVFVAIKQATDSMKSTISSECPSCSVTSLDVTLQQQESNAIVPAVVAALQRDPSIRYVLVGHGVLIPGLPAALKAAGISNITIAGATATSENEQAMLDGTESVFTDENYAYDGLAAVDVALRALQGMTVQPNDGGSPMQLLTKATVGTPSDTLGAPTDALAQFLKLWKVS